MSCGKLHIDTVATMELAVLDGWYIYIGDHHMTGYSAAAKIKRGKRLGSNDGGVDGRGV